MKLTISKESLLEQLTHVAGAVEKKQTSKILENILLNLSETNLQLVGTDLEIELSANVTVQAEETGQITAPARKLLDICRALPDDSFILLETDNNRLYLKGLRSRFELATLPADEFPLLDDIPIQHEITIAENILKELLDHVAFSMANQDVRYYLNGLYLDFNESGLSAVATDGHRLAISTLPAQQLTGQSGLNPIIVPRKAVLELTRLLDSSCDLPLNLQTSENHLRIIKDSIRFTSKLIDGKYPDYQAAIPTTSRYMLELDRDDFKNTLSRVAILSNEKFRGIKLSLKENLMTLHSNNPENESAEEELDIQFAGEPFEIGFNVTYLLEAVNHLEGKTLCLNLNSADSSALLHSPDQPEIKYVVMPIRL